MLQLGEHRQSLSRTGFCPATLSLKWEHFATPTPTAVRSRTDHKCSASFVSGLPNLHCGTVFIFTSYCYFHYKTREIIILSCKGRFTANLKTNTAATENKSGLFFPSNGTKSTTHSKNTHKYSFTGIYCTQSCQRLGISIYLWAVTQI